MAFLNTLLSTEVSQMQRVYWRAAVNVCGIVHVDGIFRAETLIERA
jgi:hypothetical protein